MRDSLGWTERDDEGKKWDVEASRNRNHWTFARRRNRRHEWEDIDPPGVERWEKLLDVVERKYQRRGCAWRDVEQVQTFLEQAKEQEPNQ